MKIQEIQDHDCNTNFYARFILKDFTKGIGKETLNLWEKRAKSIGSDKDLITLTLNMPRYVTSRKNTDITQNMTISAAAEIKGKRQQANKHLSEKNSRELYKSMTRFVSGFFDRLN